MRRVVDARRTDLERLLDCQIYGDDPAVSLSRETARNMGSIREKETNGGVRGGRICAQERGCEFSEVGIRAVKNTKRATRSINDLATVEPQFERRRFGVNLLHKLVRLFNDVYIPS